MRVLFLVVSFLLFTGCGYDVKTPAHKAGLSNVQILRTLSAVGKARHCHLEDEVGFYIQGITSKGENVLAHVCCGKEKRCTFHLEHK